MKIRVYDPAQMPMITYDGLLPGEEVHTTLHFSTRVYGGPNPDGSGERTADYGPRTADDEGHIYIGGTGTTDPDLYPIFLSVLRADGSTVQSAPYTIPAVY